MEKLRQQNTFQGGLVLDAPEYQTSNEVYTYAENITFITHKGNEMILQNEKGTVLKAFLKNNYIPIATKSYGQICYIISAEVFAGKFTGRGEIGSFPSPDYNSAVIENEDCIQCVYKTKLTDDYRPFMNYAGDNNIPINPASFNINYGEFNSLKFNFKEDNPMKICAIQPSYDDTVNVIFTDWYNKPKLINSRFTVRPEGNVDIIDRRGTGDDNLYDENSFNDKLNQIIISNKLVSIDYKGNGIGKLANGNYIYYFKYITQDSNLTNIIAESFTCSVFHGNSVITSRGGVPNESTNKSNILLLKNLDTSYNKLKVYFTYSSGESSSDAEVKLFEIENIYSFNDTSYTFTHTGFENTQPADLAELNIDYNSVDTYRTCCEVQGRFFAANIKSKEYNYDPLRIFSSKIKTFSGTSLLQINGLDSDNKHEAINSILGSNIVSGTDGYDGGYYNPYNIYNRLGYWGGETYMFGIQYYFKDGSLSPVFPIRGIDNFNNDANYTNDDLFNDKIKENFPFENIYGVYRVPNRNILGLEESQKAINIFIKFNIPVPNKEVLESTIGFRFVRAKKRKRDIITQGILFNTMIIPLNDYSIPFERKWGVPRAKSSDEVAKLCGKLWDYDNEGTGSLGFAESNSKFIPAFDFMVDSSTTYRTLGLNEGVGGRSNESASTGIEMARFDGYAFLNLNKGKNFIANNINKRFAFISPDLISNPISFSSKFDSSKKVISLLADLDFIYAIPTKNEHSRLPDKRGFFSLMKMVKANKLDRQNYTVKTDWVIYNNSFAIGDGKFSSKCLFQASMTIGHDNSSNNNKFLNRRVYSYSSLIFNSYLGIKSEQDIIIRPFDIDLPENNNEESGFMLNSSDVQNEYNNFTEGRTLELKGGAKLVNIYREGDFSNTLEWFKIHIPEYESYIPITQPYYWNREIAIRENANLNEINLYQNEIRAFNGDNFIQLSHRRIAFNGEDSLIEDGQTWRDCHVGYSLAFLSESNTNLAAQNISVVNINEGTRSFIPYYTNGSSSINVQDTKGGGNKWREYRLPESEANNTGFDKIGSDKLLVAISDNLPFILNRFNTRIIYSQPYLQSGFANGYRTFNLLSKEDYTQNFGEIVEINTVNGNQILVVYEYGTQLLGISERYGIQGDGLANSSSIFFESIGVLPKPQYAATISSIYGSKWQFSIKSTDNTVYGVDIDKAKIWQFQGNGLKLISDFKVQKFLRRIKDEYDNKKESFLGHQIRTYYDVLKNDVIFSFIKRIECGTERIVLEAQCPNISYDNDTINISGGRPPRDEVITKYCPAGEQLIYNELTGQFLTFTNWIPTEMFTIQDKLYSFDKNRLYKHYEGEYSVYYDSLRETKVEFIVTSSTSLHQIFENFFIIQNHVYPIKIEYWTEDDYFIQTIKPRNEVKYNAYASNPLSNIQEYDCVYKEDHMYITIIKDLSDIRKQFSYINRRIRGKFCRVRFTYKTKEKLQIQAILTTIQQSFS